MLWFYVTQITGLRWRPNPSVGPWHPARRPPVLRDLDIENHHFLSIYIYFLLLYCSGKSQFVNQFYILFWKITIIDLLIYFIANHGKHPDWAMAFSGPWLPVGKLAVQLGSKAQLTARQRLGRPPSAGTSTQSIVS